VTGRDPFPFGRHKGVALEDVDRAYIAWLETQTWWTEEGSRWKSYRRFLQASAIGEEAELERPIERANITAEHTLLEDAPKEFILFWRRAYGERLRRDGEILYIAHLRVALTTWKSCEALYSGQAPAFEPAKDPITLE
jgi:hypothetical protein